MKKLLGIVVLGLLLSGNAYSNITVLNCNNLLKQYRYFYIDTEKKNVGMMYFYKKENNYLIYDWWYKNIKFSKNLISLNDPAHKDLGYDPDSAPFSLIEIDRVIPATRFYSKYKEMVKLKTKYKYLPDFLIKLIGKNFLDWNLYTTVKCKVVQIPKNIRFISKAELDKKIENLKPKAKF